MRGGELAVELYAYERCGIELLAGGEPLARRGRRGRDEHGLVELGLRQRHGSLRDLDPRALNRDVFAARAGLGLGQLLARGLAPRLRRVAMRYERVVLALRDDALVRELGATHDFHISAEAVALLNSAVARPTTSTPRARTALPDARRTS